MKKFLIGFTIVLFLIGCGSDGNKNSPYYTDLTDGDAVSDSDEDAADENGKDSGEDSGKKEEKKDEVGDDSAADSDSNGDLSADTDMLDSDEEISDSEEIAADSDAVILTSIDVSKSDVALDVGNIYELRARAVFSDGTREDITIEAEWSSSDPEKLALTKGKKVVVAEALAKGSFKVTVAYEGLSSEISVTVKELLYNDVYQKSAHNAYYHYEGLVDMLLYHRIRSVELDLHPTGEGTWGIYHNTSVEKWHSSCTTLKGCLSQLKVFHDAVPEHEVVTVWLDMKRNIFGKTAWVSGNGPGELKSALYGAIGAENIFTVENLIERGDMAFTAREALADAGWPSLKELRGKFMFVLTGYSDDLQAYMSNGAVAFAAPEISEAEEMDNFPNAVFFNFNGSNEATKDVRARGFVSRTYKLISSESFWNSSIENNTHHIAVNEVNYLYDTWSRTHMDNGYPFAFFDNSRYDGRTEKGNLMGISVDSGDIWDSSDSFHFHARKTNVTPHSLKTLVSVPASHTEDWAKGCLMARVSLDADSPYLAVCKPAADEYLRIQVRREKGGSTDRTEAPELVSELGIDQEHMAWIRLDVSDRCATGYASHDGELWAKVGDEVCFGESLAYEGLAASSHGGGEITFLFASTFDGENQLDFESFDISRSVGEVSSSVAFDGFYKE